MIFPVSQNSTLHNLQDLHLSNILLPSPIAAQLIDSIERLNDRVSEVWCNELLGLPASLKKSLLESPGRGYIIRAERLNRPFNAPWISKSKISSKKGGESVEVEHHWWMSFPTTKAVINARHYELLSGVNAGNRPPARDALTLFDEDGVAVVSTDAELLDLVRDFRWKELFWHRRDEVEARMRFRVFGHALFSKAMQPFVGLTGKAVLPSELEQLPDLTGYLKAASSPVWLRVKVRRGA